jgi:hypothetical protein
MFRFLFGTGPDPGPPRPPPRPTMLIQARNEVGEVVLLEVPAPVKSDVHPRLLSPVSRSWSFRDYDSGRGRK